MNTTEAPRIESVGNLLTLRQAAKEKGVHYDSVRLWVRRNKVPVVRLGRSILLDRKELVKYIPMKLVQ